MSLMKISNQAENDHFESFLRSLPGVTEMWLGLFRGPTSPHPDDFVWSDGDAPTWTNWDNDTLDIIGSNSTANETMCIKAKITEPSGMFWVASPCTDLMEYSCQVGLNASIIPNDLSQAMCPKLVKLDGKDLNRTNSDKNYGYFDIEHSIDSMGNQVGSKLLATPAYSTSECALHCLSNSLCEEAIIISDALCILYSKL
ncbi:uncharacterized protein [Argopecten irradians]|uniref:uncharacterized protein n=1 Tax=Argopecten irradians TaxID=31199 RepID=UPI003711FF14